MVLVFSFFKFIFVVCFNVLINICECCSNIMFFVEYCVYKFIEKVNKILVYYVEFIKFLNYF